MKVPLIAVKVPAITAITLLPSLKAPLLSLKVLLISVNVWLLSLKVSLFSLKVRLLSLKLPSIAAIIAKITPFTPKSTELFTVDRWLIVTFGQYLSRFSKIFRCHRSLNEGE